MKNKQAKQMMCDVIRENHATGFLWWDCDYGLIVDGWNDIEYTFAVEFGKPISIKANEVK